MKIKSILSIAAFSTAFIASTFFAGLFVDKSDNQSILTALPEYETASAFRLEKEYDSVTAQQISVLLQKDDLYGKQRNRKLNGIDNTYGLSAKGTSYYSAYARITSEYADKSRSMEVDALPQEFQIAWRNHMKAWRDYANFLEDVKTASIEDKSSENTFNSLEAAYNNEINRTWYEVLRVADDYGSDFSPYDN